jgi:hypothetical protein
VKTLIQKEIRLLLPAWIIAIVLATVPGIFNIALISTNPTEFLANDNDGSFFFFVQLAFAAGVLFLGINSFGEEMSYNTFSALLSQPMRRRRIWLIKIATLAAAFISVWLSGILFDSWQIGILNQWFRSNESGAAFEFITLSALVTFSGGLWTTLLLRQVTGAFWFTLLTPLAIILGISVVFQDWIVSGKSFNTFVVGALVLYSVGGFFLARRLFMRAQDVQWTGGEISLPRHERVSKIKTETFSGRPRHWVFALAWKEFQLHQGVLLIAAIILALHLTAWVIRMFHPHIQNPDLEFVAESIWLLWLLMPLLIGTAAIAEERRLGTLEPQLWFSVSRGAQLFVKFCVTLVLSLIFGALTPVLIEGTKTLDYWHWIFVVAAAISLISFYASSLSRTTLQAIGWAILVGLVIYIKILVLGPPRVAYNANPELILELLKQYLDAAVLLIVLSWLTFSNFKHVHQDWKFWMRNFLAILAVFCCVPVLINTVWKLVRP